MSESVLPVFPKSFIVSGLIFRSLIHFEFPAFLTKPFLTKFAERRFG